MSDLHSISTHFTNTAKMPVLFVGHGSPMIAIEENEFVTGFRSIAGEIPKPSAIVCISAHWETQGTRVTAMEKPKMIYDFGGFPKELYEIEYPALGSPKLAQLTQDSVTKTELILDKNWGLDHGCWTVLKHIYPAADIPVIQISLDHAKSPQYHYELAQELAFLRHKGVLIIGSGNIVHNLRMIAWDQMDTSGYGYDWAKEANEKVKKLIQDGDFQSLINYRAQGKAFDMSVPTPEHYLPLLYALALKDNDDVISFFNDNYVAGSLSMTSLKIGV